MSKTDLDKQALIEQLKKSPIVQVACQKVGISRATYYRWRKESEEFAQVCDEALAEGVELINDLSESQLLSAIHQGNITSIIYWLKNHHKTYETRIKVQGTIKHQAEALTDEQSELVQRALSLGGLINNEGEQDE